MIVAPDVLTVPLMRTDSPRVLPGNWPLHAAPAADDNPAFMPDGYRASGTPAAEPEQKAKLLADWQLVKRARFHAAARLGRRNSASLITLSTVALYGGLVTVFVLIFKDSLTPHIRSICDWVSVVANWLTLTFSLTEQIKDYGGQSRALHECAQQVNDLRKRLEATPINSSRQLIPFVQEYDTHITACGPNHDDLDYHIGRLAGGRPVDGLSAAEAAAKLRWLRAWSRISNSTIYVVMSLAPLIAGLTAWLLVPAPGGH